MYAQIEGYQLNLILNKQSVDSMIFKFLAKFDKNDPIKFSGSLNFADKKVIHN